MPEPNTHTAIGMGAGYIIGTIAGLNPDYLVIGTVGALLAAARQTPTHADDGVGKMRQSVIALANIGGVSLVSASSTSILLVQLPSMSAAGIGIAALIGFFGQPIIASATEIIGKSWQIISSKFGGG